MKVYPDCYPCFFKQAVEASRMVTSDEEMVREIVNALSERLPRFPKEAKPPEVGKEIYRIIFEKTGIADPFRRVKNRCLHQALALYPKAKEIVSLSKDRLLTAVKLSVAGNAIDFGAPATFDFALDLEKILSQDFAINNYREFSSALQEARTILYLADNAGETVFDRILIEELPKPVAYAVRERPIINDATREDAVCSGIDRVARIISSGSDFPGTILRFCSAEFLERFHAADLIISKGQGNYECLSEEEGPLFYFLKVKCTTIARHLQVKEGSLILMKS